METKTVTYIDYDEFESLVEQTIPAIKEYSICADEELGNDCARTYSTTIKDIEQFIRDQKESQWDINKLNDLLVNGKYGYTSYMIVTYLTMKGVLPLGDLVIKISW